MTVPKELNFEAEIKKGISVGDFLRVGIVTGFAALALRPIVYDKLQWVFVIFVFILSVILTGKSRSNIGKRRYQAIYLAYISNKDVYHEAEDLSNEDWYEEMVKSVKEAAGRE